MVWMIFGNAVHHILEKHDESGFAEIRLEHLLDNGYTISGILDLYNEELAEVVDYKTASIYKVLKKDFDDWRRQGWIYGFLLVKDGKKCEKVKFHALLKDWSARAKKQARLRKEDYPDYPVFTTAFNFGEKELMATEKFLIAKTNEIAENEQLPDDQLIECTPEERWADAPKFAVYAKQGDKKAKRLFDTREEAEQYSARTSASTFRTDPGKTRSARTTVL